MQDLLWLGHCGSYFPHGTNEKEPIGRVVIPNDTTVPAHQHFDHQLGGSELVDEYANHTRVVSRVRGNFCTAGHAVNQLSALRFLYELGINKMDGATDNMLRGMCEGTSGRKLRTCLTVQPPLFMYHRVAGPSNRMSDIQDKEVGYIQQPFTRNIRWATRVNLAKLVEGETDYIDLFEDGADRAELGFY